MDAIIKLGECIVMQTCLVLFFIGLGSLASLRFGLFFKVAKPILGFLIGLSVGAYLTSLISYDAVPWGGILGGVLGIFAVLSLGSLSERA
ncbi:MAG: hypothetical protein ACK2T5_16045 [Anaerolineales bacterium]|jgi:hypothetical protein